MQPTSPPTVELLQSYYPTVLSVQQYLARSLESGRDDATFLTDLTDSVMYRSLLLKGCVGSRQAVPQARFKAIPPMIHLRELIERAQLIILRRTINKPNVLTAGYRRSGSTLTNYFLNTIVTALHAPEWETLFQRIGEDAMFHLVTETCLFFPLPNGCFCQMTGEPIVYTAPPLKFSLGGLRSGTSCESGKRKRTAKTTEGEPPAKRSKTSASSSSKRMHSSDAQERKTPMDIAITRAHIFYSRPFYVTHTNLVVIGLSPHHVLNRLSPSKHLKPESVRAVWIDPDPRDQAAHARHLSKYVFPRQYGLPTPFAIDSTTKPALRSSDHSDRESQIKALGPTGTPKRVKSVLARLEQLLWHHSKCGYRPLLQKICPSKLKNERNQPLDSSVILEMVSEHSIQLHSQAAAADPSISVDQSSLQTGVSHAALSRQAKQKPRFAEFACNHSEVYYYTVAITKVVFPMALWGSQRNFKTLCRHIQTFISLRRYESLTLHAILQGFSISDCEWLAPASKGASQQRRVSLSDSLKRLELLQDFLFWYFDSFLMNLLKTTFYVTESSAFRNRILYFRQDDWASLCAPLIERLSAETFEKMSESEAAELLRQRTLGYSFVRLLPKETGVRPIVNLRRKKPTAKNLYARQELSINQILQSAFQVLTYEKNTRRHLVGAAVFGHNDVYSKLKAFKLRLESLGHAGQLPKLYFVKVDVQACFDTITQDKLLAILRDLISEDSYMVQRHGMLAYASGKIKRTFVKSAMPDDDHPHFLNVVTKLVEVIRNTIFVDQVVYPYAHKKEILELLEEHITENIVKIGNGYYRQTVGIPQGSVLSTILCSFFYGDLERKELKFTQDPQSVLLRLVDDYLLITTNEARAQKFLDTMIKGHPEYGCFISKEKILTNLDTEDLVNTIPPTQTLFPWCGYLIDMKNLSVLADYSRFHSTYLRDSLTVESGRRAVTGFTYKMMRLVHARSHILYTDGHLNSQHVVHLNIYQNFMLVAMKMHYYLRSWKLDVTKSSKFLHTTIRQIINHSHTSMVSKAKSSTAKNALARFDVPKAHVLWLGTHAFQTVFSRKSHVYSQVLKTLAFDLSLPRYRQFKRRFRKVTNAGLDMFTLLTF